MRKLFLIACAALVLGATPAVAADNQSSVNLNVLGVLVNLYSGSFETVLPIVDKVSVKVDAAYSPNFLWVSNMGLLQMNVQGRYYLGSLLPKGLPDFLYGDPLKGLYAGAGVGFYSVWYWYESGSDKWEGSYISPDFLLEVGDKYFFDKHFYAEGYTGFDIVAPANWTWKYNGKTVSSWSGYSNSYAVGGLRLGINLGYAF